jgi:serine/threonine protein kinase
MIGKKLGPYEITAKLGEGGMGEVYRATDSRLKREVAIKVLPAAFTEDKERLARFEREAQLLAQLHHPNIASIFGLEESGGTRALVMELVEGPTLAERLEAGAFSITESLSSALQIAQALEEAHDKGIVHRDLKPQNIKVSGEGKTKVLDFGLAKAMDAGGSGASAADLARSPTLVNSPTLTAAHGTQLGVKVTPLDRVGLFMERARRRVGLRRALPRRAPFRTGTRSAPPGTRRLRAGRRTAPRRAPLPVRRSRPNARRRAPRARRAPRLLAECVGRASCGSQHVGHVHHAVFGRGGEDRFAQRDGFEVIAARNLRLGLLLHRDQ